MSNPNGRDKMAGEQSDHDSARTAVMALLDNIILHLERHDFLRAERFAGLLVRERPRVASLCFDVVRFTAMTATLRRGAAEIRAHAQESALDEFKNARTIWSRRTATNQDPESQASALSS
jgi:hypothetical protein